MSNTVAGGEGVSAMDSGAVTAAISAVAGGGLAAAIARWRLGSQRIERVDGPAAAVMAMQAANQLLLSQLESLRRDTREEINGLRDTVSRQSQRLDDQGTTMDRLHAENAELRASLARANSDVERLEADLKRAYTREDHLPQPAPVPVVVTDRRKAPQ